MNIALIGYGNMGKQVEAIISEGAKHTITSVSYRSRSGALDLVGIKKADVAIDFSVPDAVYTTMKKVIPTGTPLVVGTTGWYAHVPRVKSFVAKYKTGLVYGQNFSVGANIYFLIVKYAATLFNRFSDYDVFGVETHHAKKKDSPSGTARKIAEIILANSTVKTSLVTEALNRQIRRNELHFASVRGGTNYGRHEVAFDSAADEVRLIHQAAGRRGFAEGAILAAEFIKNRKGLYNFSEIFDTIVRKQK